MDYTKKCPELVEGVKCLSPIQVSVRVINTRGGMQVKGNVAGTVELVCTRCLEPITYHVEAAFDEEFFPVGGNQYEMWLEQQKEPGVYPLGLDDNFYSDNLLDVSRVVRDSFIMAIPLNPVCKPDCLGICPHCGANRNQQPCECEGAQVDPRLEILRQLMDQE